ncbi:MAG: 3-deoxy-D-manno-octulosonic acid transferase [Candidatus Binatia bacterium]
MWFLGYNILLTMVFLLILPFTPLLQLIGKRFSAGLAQRLGYFPHAQLRALAATRPVWIHASSVGEVGSVTALVRELKNRHPQRRIVLSTFTATGNETAQKFAGVDAVIYLPLDFCWTVRRALTQWNPSLMLFVETEIWPNLLRECFRRGIPTVLVSGRLSARSLPRYERFRGFFCQVVRRFAAIGMQTGEDAARIVRLGADANKVSVVGSLKWAGAAPQSWRFTDVPRHGKRLLIAGSTHAGEEQMLLASFAALRPRFPELSMVLAPRHPERFAEVEALLRGSGFSWCRRSVAADDRLFATDILLLDTVGELSDFFAVGDVAFVGGSLVDVGGHNILEPARSGKAILFGPYMANMQAVAEQFKAQGAAIEVADSAALSTALANLLSDDGKRIAMGRLALAASANGDGAVQRNYALAARYLSDSLVAPAPVE